jgi:hypothetical protein
MSTIVGAFFGGPDDGATLLLTPDDLARGFVDTIDPAGNTVRHTIVKLDIPKQVFDSVVDYELRPTEGVW